MILEIELADNSGRLDLDPDVSIEFEQIFNLHDFEHIEGSKSWKFKLPKTPHNRRLTGWVDLPQLRSSFENNIKVRINLQGSLWKVGLLYFINDRPEYWNVHFAGEAGLLKQLIGEKKLTDFSYPDVTGISNMYDHAATVAQTWPPTHDYAFFEVYCPNKKKVDSDGNSIGLGPFLNPYGYDANFENWAGFSGMISGNYSPLCPFPYVKSVLQHIGTELGVTFGGDLWADEEFSRMCFFTTLCLNELVGEDELPIGEPGNTINIGNHLPDDKLSDLLKDISKLFNQQVVYDDQTNSITFQNRTRLLAGEVNGKLRYKVNEINNDYQERRTYNLRYEYDEQDVELTKGNTVVQDLSGVDGPEGSSEVLSKYSTLPMMEINISVSGITDYVRPVTHTDLQEQHSKFLFYRGFAEGAQNTGIEVDTPYGSSDLNYTPSTGYSLDAYSLKWKGANGLYATWWQNYLEKLRLSRILKARLVWDIVDLYNFNPNNIYAILEYVCLFEETKLKINGNRLVAEAQLLKL